MKPTTRASQLRFHWSQVSLLLLGLGCFGLYELLRISLSGLTAGDTLSLELLAIGSGLGVVSGWLGIGGAILGVPFLMVLSPQLNATLLTPQHIGAIAASQSLASAMIALPVYHQTGHTSPRESGAIGIIGGIMAVTGGLALGVVKTPDLLTLFLIMSILSIIILWRPTRQWMGPPWGPYIGSALIGLLGGITGIPGSYLLTPLVFVCRKVSLREAIGTTLGAIIYIAAASLLVKWLNHQLLFSLAVPTVLGAACGGYCGSRLSLRTPPYVLRAMLTLSIGIAIAFMSSRFI